MWARDFNAKPVPSFANRALTYDVIQQPEKARPLDCACKLTLLLGRNRRDAAWHDLAALRDIALQQLHVLVVDLRRVGAGKRAGLAAAEKRAAALGCCELHDAYSSAAAAGSSSRRSRRGPRSRSKRSPRSKRPPPRSSRSRSRSTLRIIAEGPSSCSSTRTVRERRTSSESRSCRSTSVSAAGGASSLNRVKCALRFLRMRKESVLTPQYSGSPTSLPPRPSMTPLKLVVMSSTCCALKSWRAR